MKPPGVWVALLERCLPEEERDGVVGDLLETFEVVVEREGGRAARAWFRREAVRVAGRFLLAGPRRHWARDGRRGGGMEQLRNDVRVSLRVLTRRWGLSAWSVAAIAIGVGFTTTTFSIVWGSLLRGLPVPESERLVHFERRTLEGNELPVSHHDYLDWRDGQRGFTDLGAYVEAPVTLSAADGVPIRLEGLSTNRATFDVLGVAPRQGRLFLPDEEARGGDDVVVLSHRAWSTVYGADPGLVGRTIVLDGRPTTVIGVMPEGFHFPFSEDVWLPLRLDRAAVRRGRGRLDVIGRLAPGVSFDQATADLERVAIGLEERFPETNLGIRPAPMSFNREFVGEDFPRIAAGLLAGSLLVLLVACVNVASLNLVRISSRVRELALRRALGADRARLVRQLLTEAFLVAGPGALLGALLARQAVDAFGRAVFREGTLRLPHGSVAPYWWQFEVDGAALLFTVALTFLVTVAVGLLPAVLASRADALGALRSRTASVGVGWRGPLIAVETAVAGVVLGAAAIMMTSYSALGEAEGTIHTEDLVVARVALPQDDDTPYPTHADRVEFWRAMADALERVPTIRRASVSTAIPMTVAPFTPIETEGTPTDGSLGIRVATVTPEFFETFGLAPIEGRVLGVEDTPGGELVVVINESLATRHFAGESPIGRRLRLGGEEATDSWLTVVGVVPDHWMDGERSDRPYGAYTALAQAHTPDPVARHGRLGLWYGWVTVELEGGVRVGAEAIRSALREIDPAIPLYGMASFEETVATRLRRYRLFGAFYLSFGLVALFLAVLGIYTVTSHSVASRRSELGIRAALGANASQIRARVMSREMRAIAAGLIVVVIVARPLAQSLQGIVFGSEPSLGGVAIGVVTLAAAGLVACLVPASRAAKTDPTDALRAASVGD